MERVAKSKCGFRNKELSNTARCPASPNKKVEAVFPNPRESFQFCSHGVSFRSPGLCLSIQESLEEIGLPRPMVASERSGGSPRCFKATKRATLESRSVRYGLCAGELNARRTVCQMSGGDSLGIGCERSVAGMALVF